MVHSLQVSADRTGQSTRTEHGKPPDPSKSQQAVQKNKVRVNI